jgi:hypothetical protein
VKGALTNCFGLVRTLMWTTGDGFNDRIGTISVHPMENLVVANRITAPRLAHLGRHFCYWNGSLEYKIQVACSDLHTGKLMVVFHPGSGEDNLDTTSTNPHLLLDVKQQHEIIFKVPFASPTAWKPTYIANPFADIATTRTGTITVHSADSIKSALQQISNVTVNIFVRATPSFQYAVPRNGLMGPNRISTTITQESILTSIVPNNKLNNEDFNDLYKVMRRYVPLGGAINVPALAANTPQELIAIPVTPILGDLVNANAISLLSSGFAFWRGSLKYKIKVIGATGTAFEVIHHPTMGLPAGRAGAYFRRLPQNQEVDAGAFCGSQTFHADIDKEWEVVVPYYSMYDWLHLPLVNYGDTAATLANKLPLLSTNNGCLILRPLFNQVGFNVTVTVAVGEDFTLGGAGAFPSIPIPEGTVVPSNVNVVVQGTIDPYPKFLRNDLFRSAWDALPVTHIARQSRTQFNKHYYKYCAECNCNVFMHLHAERCRPITKFVGKREINADPQALEGVFQFFTKLNNSNDILAEIAEELKGKKDEIHAQGTVKWLVETIGKFIKEAASQASFAVRNWVATMLPEVDWKLFVSAMVCAATVYALRDQLSNPLAKMAIIGMSVLVPHKFLVYVEEYVREYMEIPIRVQQGSGIDLSFATIAQLCCGVLTFFLTMGSKGSATRLLKSAGDLGRSFSGIKSGVEALTIFTSWLKEKLIPELSASEGKVLHSLMANALDTLAAVDALNLEEMKVRCLTEEEIKEQVLRTYDDLVELHRTALGALCPPGIMGALNNCLRKMEKLRSEVVAFKGNVRYRVDPFHVSIYGPPGCGKSACMNQIAEDMRAIHNWALENLLYTRLVDTEYWDGYLGQTIVIYDDLAQVVTDAPNDITELIGIKSNSPYIVHMASLQDKGRYFSSKLIISSTNMKSVRNYPGLRDPDSFHRRRNVLLEMKRLVDADGEPQVFGGGPNGQGHAMFRFLHSISTEPLSDWMTYEDMMVEVIQRSETYYAEQKALVDRNGSDIKPSTVAQAILDARLPKEVPGVVETGGEFIFTDVEAQAFVDALPEAERVSMIQRWTDIYNAAFKRRDFAAMTSGFTYSQKSRIVDAMRQGKDAVVGLTRAEKAVVRQYNIHDRLKSSWYNVVATTQEQAERVTTYFSNMWKEVPEERRRYLSTALVGIAAVGVAAALAFTYSKLDNKDRETNEIPLSVFTEAGTYVEKNKDRKYSHYKVEGHDDFPTWEKKKPNTPLTESGIDDYKTRRAARKVFAVESGIDDYKTRRIARKTFRMEGAVDVSPEGIFTSPMSLDVKPELIELTEEDLLAEMRKITEEPTEPSRQVATLSADYKVVGETQASNDPDAHNFIENALLDNLALVWQPKSTIRMKAVMVDDRFLVVPKHFFATTLAGWEEGDVFHIRLRQKNYQQSFTWDRCFYIKNRDIAVYLLTARVTGVRSILPKIASRGDHSNFRTTTGNLVGLSATDKGEVYVKTRMLATVNAMATADSERVSYDLGKERHVLRGYRYYADTVNGECGSVLVQDNKRQNAKIVGFHVAASIARQMAFSEMLVREEIETAVNNLTHKAAYIKTRAYTEPLRQSGVLRTSNARPQRVGRSPRYASKLWA